MRPGALKKELTQKLLSVLEAKFKYFDREAMLKTVLDYLESVGIHKDLLPSLDISIDRHGIVDIIAGPYPQASTCN